MGDREGWGRRWRTFALGLGTRYSLYRDLGGQPCSHWLGRPQRDNLLNWLGNTRRLSLFLFGWLGGGHTSAGQYGGPGFKSLHPLIPCLFIPRCPLGVSFEELLHCPLQFPILGLFHEGEDWFADPPVLLPSLPLHIHLRSELRGLVLLLLAGPPVIHESWGRSEGTHITLGGGFSSSLAFWLRTHYGEKGRDHDMAQSRPMTLFFYVRTPPQCKDPPPPSM